MARKFVTDASLESLVVRLARLVHIEGSVLATSRRLNAALLAAGRDRSIYPNRLAALLSDDSAQSVNDQTIGNVQNALDLIWSSEIDGTFSTDLESAILSAWANSPSKSGSTSSRHVMQTLADAMQVPLAVIRVALERAGQLAHPTRDELASSPTPLQSTTPDWSFQDDAVRLTSAALRETGCMKAGLVLPTGGGKTRSAMRIALSALAEGGSNSVVLWVTHRRFLRTMAIRELQRAMAAGTPDLPDDAVKLLANRVEIILISQLAAKLDQHYGRVTLVVVDEAHHAATPSYAPIFATSGLRGLFLTATPNRTDAQKIGIDRIAYTITYRELFKRRVLVEPRFEPPLVVPPDAWRQENGLDDLCNYILQRSRSEFVKTIVVVSRVEHVEKLHAALLHQLKQDDDAVITPDEVGFVHGSGCSSDSSPEAYLDVFTAFERGILVSTAQMLGEGFDDPKVNAVVLTYPTTSMVQLMQVGGRALRASPGKTSAYIVQAKESNLGYHFEQRWLYQDIVDTLHPRLIDYTYGSKDDLIKQVNNLLPRFGVDLRQATSIAERLLKVPDGESVSILLSGMPFVGEKAKFDSIAEWHPVLVTEEEREEFLAIFNDFSEFAGEVKATEFLSRYVPVNTEPGSPWLKYRDMLTAMEYARRECANERYSYSENRPYDAHRGTTWLTYVTFRYVPLVPMALQQFLEDAVNRNALSINFSRDPQRWWAAIKVDYPLGGSYACLLDYAQMNWCVEARKEIVQLLHDITPDEAFAQIALWRCNRSGCPIPQWLLERLEDVISDVSIPRRWLSLRDDDQDSPA